MSIIEAVESSTGYATERDAHVRSIVQQFRIIFRSIQDHSRWVERQCGVSAAQLWAMFELSAHPGIRVSELSKALSIHQSTASNMLDKLEKKGLVARKRKSSDQRVVRLYLTDKGAELVAPAPRPAHGALSRHWRTCDAHAYQRSQGRSGAALREWPWQQGKRHIINGITTE